MKTNSHILSKQILKVVVLSLVLSFNYGYASGQNKLSIKDISVLEEPADTMMKSYLNTIVDRQFAVRDSLLGTIKSAKDWDLRAQSIRDSMASWTGPFPERTPLNARVTGRLERDGYIIEKILFESRQNYLVSANLYLPKNISSPRPAHLNVIGHAQDGKANERYQRMSVAQAKNGFVVLTIDQLGQGERGLLSAHKIIGAQAFISGTHIFNFMVWDAIRAIDYLVSRPEVDPENICMTGSSGGGMMTTYVLPFDDRIAVAVPTCNPNTWSYRARANLATDHEQVFFGAFGSSIDPRGDPLFAHVPKPLLLNTTTDDPLNPPRGVWDLNTWLYKSYAAHGVPEKITTSMVRAGHAYNQEQREITYSWMRRWTGNDASGFREEEISLEKEEDLWAASGGSVFNEPGSKKDHDLVLDYLNEHKANWGVIKSTNALKSHKTEMARLIRSVLNTNLYNINFTSDFKNKKNVGDISIRPFVLKPEPGIVLPGVLLEPMTSVSNRGVILYISENGKTEILKDFDIVKEMLGTGYSICAVDLRGIGETSPDMANKFWDFLAGKPIFGQRVKDILVLLQWLKGPEVEARDIKLWGTGMCAVYGAFAGALNDDVSGFVFEEPLLSFESVVQVDMPAYNHEVLLPGILEKFDMAQVYQALCPRPVSIINPLSGDKSTAGRIEMENTEKPVSTAYRVLKRQKAWSMSMASGDERERIIVDCFEGN
jgi:dienelactone hydrolase